MAQHTQQHTVHTIYIDITDDALSKIEPGDEVRVVLQSRFGQTGYKRLNPLEVEVLTVDGMKPRRIR